VFNEAVACPAHGPVLHGQSSDAVSILKISEILYIFYEGNLFWNILREFVNNDDTVTSIADD